MIRIHNMRFGHATNSSSSHSIVIVPKDLAIYTDDYDGGMNFGWEQFCLADPESKSRYFAASLWFSLTEKIGPGLAASAIRDWLGIDVTEFKDEIGVDHQSALEFPISQLTPEFMEQLKSFIHDDRVVIYGGNDNDGEMDLPEGAKEVEFIKNVTDTDTSGMILRQDGKFWTMYEKNRGTKVRFSLDVDDEKASEYTKSTLPELVDLKITNKCNYGCEFCYQASTPEGLHADRRDINTILYNLQSMGVFEIAIGGGEPTDHPDFADIIDTTAVLGMVPNFTTFGVSWLKNEQIVQSVKDSVGGIGVSVHSVKDLNKVQKIAEAINGNDQYVGVRRPYDQVSIMAQHVVGTAPLDDTVELITKCWYNGIPILLLGYKDVGFGFDYKTNTMEGMDMAIKITIDKALKKNWGVSLSVDTAFVDQHPSLMKLLEIDDVLTSSPEGKFSMYWDAVEKKIGPSSYCSPDEMTKLSDRWFRDDAAEVREIYLSY